MEKRQSLGIHIYNKLTKLLNIEKVKQLMLTYHQNHSQIQTQLKSEGRVILSKLKKDQILTILLS
jgi:hypothetical protein